MNDSASFVIRTEDIRPDEILNLFVPTDRDLQLISALKSTNPTILEGSRGTGKSFLLRVCEQEQFVEFNNAAVYPGVTSYGSSFEAVHDAQIESLNRDILAATYQEQMREIVLKQSGSELQSYIEKNGENFDALSLAVSGNPRLLLKTVALAGRLRSSDSQHRENWRPTEARPAMLGQVDSSAKFY